MQIVINIDEKIYKRVLPYKDVPVISNLVNDFPEITHAVANGEPLPIGHGKLKDVDKFLEKVKKDREHEIYLHSWTADMVLKRLDSWYAPTILEADRSEEE